MVDHTQNFFKQERKATLKRLLAFVRQKGYKETCPECGAKLDESTPRVLSCPNCKPLKSWPCLPGKMLIAQFMFGDGGTKHTVRQYVDDLLDAGFIQFRADKDTYEALC